MKQDKSKAMDPVCNIPAGSQQNLHMYLRRHFASSSEWCEEHAFYKCRQLKPETPLPEKKVKQPIERILTSFDRCLLRCKRLVRKRADKRMPGVLQFRYQKLAVISLTMMLTMSPLMADEALTLSRAEQLALMNDPGVVASQARSLALSEDAIADGQLPDPKVKAGIFNLPLDTFELDRQPTTQLRLGLQQAFPRGKTLLYRQRRTEWKSTAEQAKAENTARKVLRDTRNRFLELYYQLQAEQVIEETRALFSQLVDITEAHYATGRVSQQDVLRASLELSRLDDRSTRIRNEAEKNRASLMKWIGDAALQSVDKNFPDLPKLPEKEKIDTFLPEHPAIRAENARIESFKQGVQIAQEQYKPGWNIGLEYRKRFGDDPDGSSRTDMMAAMVTVDLPLFPDKRQDRRLAASVKQTEAARLTRADRLRELKATLDSDYASWLRLGERADLYQSHLLQEASANTTASLKAYQSGVTEFTTLMRARITDLDVRLEALRIRVDRAKAQARLLYLAGETNENL
ncbi:MAG TPA: TolC family protein [Chromatiales bacterium]|nr:TolC family protein [Chromatiales bacterium]